MKNLVLWLLLCVATFAHSQTITVQDKENGLPLEFVTLTGRSPRVDAITNIKGQADISGFKNTESIEIRMLGYKPVKTNYQSLTSEGLTVEMETYNLNLNEVVISANRWRQSSNNVPSTISTITPKQIALQNPQTAADLLTVSGKVYVQKSQQGGGSPMIRGFATNRLLYTVDGVRMNTAIFRGGNIQNVINLDPFAIERTEVLFGPGSVIYGSDAIGGVMSFKTLSPQFSLTDELSVSGKAVARYSSANNEKTTHFDINIGGKKWAFLSSFSSWDYDHLRQGSHGPEEYIKPYYVQRQDSMDKVIVQDDPLLQIPSAYSQLNLMQKVSFKPSENWLLEYGFHYSETSPYGRYDRHNRLRNGTARYAEWYYGPQKWMMNNLSISNTASTKLYDQLSLRLAFQAFEESRIDRSFNKDDRTTNTEKVDAYSVNLDLKKSVSSSHSLFYGVEFILNDVNSKGMVTDISTGNSIDGPSRYPNSTWSSAAIYLNDEYKASEKMTVQTGLRYNIFQLDANFEENLSFYPFPFKEAKTDEGALTGSIGLVYRPSDTWVISSNFGTAFRAPNVDDIGKVFDSEPGAVTVPNPDLKAEYAYNLDVGLAKVFNDFIKVDFTAYYTLLENAMVRRDYVLNQMDSIEYVGINSRVQAIQNAAEARIYGVQAGIELRLSKVLSFSSDLNYQKGEEELDDGSTSPSRHAAPLFGTSRLTVKVNKLNLQLYSNYQGERSFEDLSEDEKGKDEIYAKDENGNNYAPAWYTLNLKAMYNLTETFTLSSGIENITDQRYRTYSSGISAPGRNVIFSLRANF